MQKIEKKLNRSKSPNLNASLILTQKIRDNQVKLYSHKLKNHKNEKDALLLAQRIQMLKFKEQQAWKNIEKCRKNAAMMIKQKSKNREMQESLLKMKYENQQREIQKQQEILQTRNLIRLQRVQNKKRAERQKSEQRNKDKDNEKYKRESQSSFQKGSKVRSLSDLLKLKKQQEQKKLVKQELLLQQKIIQEKQNRNKTEKNIKLMELEEFLLIQKLYTTRKLLKKVESNPNLLTFLEQKAKRKLKNLDLSEIVTPSSNKTIV